MHCVWKEEDWNTQTEWDRGRSGCFASLSSHQNFKKAINSSYYYYYSSNSNNLIIISAGQGTRIQKAKEHFVILFTSTFTFIFIINLSIHSNKSSSAASLHC